MEAPSRLPHQGSALVCLAVQLIWAVMWGEIPNNEVEILFQWVCSVCPSSFWTQLWAVYVFRRIVLMVPLSSLMLHCKPQRTTRKSQRQRVGEKILPSCLSPSWLGICLALLCPPSTTCLLSLAEEPGGIVLVLSPWWKEGSVPEGHHTRQKTASEGT